MPPARPESFDALIDEARSWKLEGWDFSFLQGRFTVDPLPWDYRAEVEVLTAGASTMLDLGTGGGEFVAALEVRPPLTVATEGWPPNVPVAAGTLRPLGAHVVQVEPAPDNAVQRFTDPSGRLPFRDGAFEVVIDRHEAFRATEVARVLTPGGTFLTQQVGSRNEIELNEALGGGIAPSAAPTLAEYVAQLGEAGLEPIDAREACNAKRYLDLGALLALLLMVPWQYEGFDVDRHRPQLRVIHDRIQQDGAFVVHQHRMLLRARRR